MLTRHKEAVITQIKTRRDIYLTYILNIHILNATITDHNLYLTTVTQLLSKAPRESAQSKGKRPILFVYTIMGYTFINHLYMFLAVKLFFFFFFAVCFILLAVSVGIWGVRGGGDI